MTIQFFVEGVPAPAVRKNRRSDARQLRPRVAKEYDWRSKIAIAAITHRAAFAVLKYPVSITLVFCDPNIEVRQSSDLDNLVKSTIDALVYARKLTGIAALKGDSIKLIKRINAVYQNSGSKPGVWITVEEDNN